MALVRAANDKSIMKIRAFLGLNENPDGDTNLKNGELSEMRNFRITRDRHLQIRPGCKTVLDLAALADGDDRTLYGAWRGTVGARECILAAFGGQIWEVDIRRQTAVSRGRLTGAETSFFGFGGKVYCLNGHEYLAWDGGADTTFAAVEGYVPVVQTATTPAGAGTLLEGVNRLTGKRRVEFSPDGTATTFRLPEKDIDELLSVEENGAVVTGCTMDAAAGTVKFSKAPAKGTNTVTVTYRKGEGDRSAVEKMRYSELYNGSTDTRVFLYGDGSNRTIYSGVEYTTGQPSAEYFPDLYEAAVGESNTPLTALVRHYSRMMAFKPGSAWVITPAQYGTVVMDDGNTTAAFYVQPVNRLLGNDAPGQVKMLENEPLTLDVGSVYRWKATSSAGYINASESNAKRISDRVAATLSTFDIRSVKTFNMRFHHEFWFLSSGKALVYNYDNDTWFFYSGLPYSLLLEAEEERYGFAPDGRVLRIGRRYFSDDGRPISAYAATGAMDLGRAWQLKYSPEIFVTLQPESNARITVTVETDRRSEYAEKTITRSVTSLSNVDFAHFSFRTNRKPGVDRLKIKVKKATFYKLIFKSDSAISTATVLGADVMVRYAGNVK